MSVSAKHYVPSIAQSILHVLSHLTMIAYREYIKKRRTWKEFGDGWVNDKNLTCL